MPDLTQMTAADVMTRDVVTVAPDATLRMAARLMTKHGISALPVVKGGVAVGVVSETDLIQPAAALPRRGEWWLHQLADEVEIAPEFAAALRDAGRSVGQVMQGDLVWVPETAPLSQVARMMAEEGVRRVLVLRDGAVAGIVSRRDVVRALAQG
jgi:CBS domain-containing protein